MKASVLTKATLTLVMISMCAFSFSACAEEEPEQAVAKVEIEGLTGGVAATVNGAEIEEDTITTWIQNYRHEAQLTSESSWGKWLIDSGYTVESVREKIINMYITKELIKEAAAEYGISVSKGDIDEYITQMRAYFTDSAWEATLAAKGYTEQEYRDSIELALLETAVQDGIVEPTEPTDEEILAHAQIHASTYNGAKKSSSILFSSDDEALAQEVLDKINSGELAFEDAVAEYSIDSETASDGGNVGWDALNNDLVLSYTEALSQLEVGQISELVITEYGIYIIKCTNVFTAPETITSTQEIPEEFIELFKSTVTSNKKNEAYEAWYQAYYESAEIAINEMPANLPYNIDLEKYRKVDPPAEEYTAVDLADTSNVGTEGDVSEGEAPVTEGTEGEEVGQPVKPEQGEGEDAVQEEGEAQPETTEPAPEEGKAPAPVDEAA